MIILDNQPISFNPYFETDSDCNIVGRKTYCQLYNSDDVLTAQWRAETCGDTLLCNIPAPQTLTTNPTFDGNSDGWDLNGTVSYNDNAIDFTSSPTAILSQSLALSEGHCYYIQFEISNYLTGEIYWELSNAQTGDPVSGNGTFSDIIVPSSDVTFFQLTGFDSEFTIDNVYIYELDCWCADNGEFNLEFVTQITGKFCHVVDPTTPLATTFTVSNVVVVNDYYKVEITVSGMTTGTLTIPGFFDVAFTDFVITNNGTYTFYGVFSSVDFVVVMSSDFDGCFYAPAIYEMPQLRDLVVNLTDLDGTFVAALNPASDNTTPYISYSNDFVNLEWDISLGDANGDAIAEGCYKICISDPCVNSNGQFDPVNCASSFVENPYASCWSEEAGVTINDGYAEMVTDGSAKDVYATEEDVTAIVNVTKCYQIEIEYEGIENMYEPADFTVTATLYDSVAGVIFTCSEVATDFDSHTMICNVTGDLNDLSVFSVAITFNNNTSGDTVRIYSAILRVQGRCMTADFCSNCISIKQDHDCTILLKGFCDESSLGFNFTNFYLTQRLRTLFINPISANRNENYKKSNGEYFKYFAERDKVFEVFFDYVDEISHDAINTMLICDHLQIFHTQNNFDDEYIWLQDSYKPEWDKEGRQNIAQSRIELRKKSGHLTNSNCS